MTKYGAKKVIYNGIKFDSKMEGDYYLELLRLQKQGKVVSIELQPKFELIPSFEKDGKKYRAMNYIADFKVTYDDGRVVIIDVKGMTTTDFLIKEKLYNYKYDLPLLLIKESAIDGGWITLDAYKKAVKERKKNKANKK